MIREERQDGRQLFSAARVQSTSGVLSFTGYDTGTRPYLRCGSHSHPGLFAHPVGRKWTGRQLSRPVRLHQAPFPLDGDGCIWRLVREVAFLRLSHSTLTTHLGTYTHPPDRGPALLRIVVSCMGPACALRQSRFVSATVSGPFSVGLLRAFQYYSTVLSVCALEIRGCWGALVGPRLLLLETCASLCSHNNSPGSCSTMPFKSFLRRNSNVATMAFRLCSLPPTEWDASLSGFNNHGYPIFRLSGR